jgi:hypothetical protein
MLIFLESGSMWLFQTGKHPNGYSLMALSINFPNEYLLGTCWLIILGYPHSSHAVNHATAMFPISLVQGL